MADRVAHDHPTIDTLEATIGRYGGTHRPEIRIPESNAVPTGDVLSVVLDGTEYHAEIQADSDGSPLVRGAYETPRLARDPGSGTNYLPGWVDDSGLDVGRTVLVDVVESGYKIGLRAPGERATYAATGTPKDSLAAIADDLDGDRSR